MSVKAESGSLKVTYKKCGRTFVVKRDDAFTCEGCIAEDSNNGISCKELPGCFVSVPIVFLREIK